MPKTFNSCREEENGNRDWVKKKKRTVENQMREKMRTEVMWFQIKVKEMGV